MNDTLHYAVGIGFALLAIAIAVVASLDKPFLILDASLKTGLFIGGFAFAGIAVTVASPSAKALRAVREQARVQ